MEYKDFLGITLQLQKQDMVISGLYKNKIDLTEIVDPYHSIIAILIKDIYGEEGYDWFSWFCYENDFGRKGLDAYDENKKPICYSHESLWSFLEGLKSTKQ
jgi:hypothetical protein